MHLLELPSDFAYFVFAKCVQVEDNSAALMKLNIGFELSCLDSKHVVNLLS
jgi:hypothetical protein